MIDGLPVAASFNGGGVSTFIYDTPNADEMQVLVSGALGEAENGGPQVNIVPKAGGNRFKGSAFYSGAGKWSTGNNLNADARRLRPDAASRRDQLVGRERLGRRPDQARQALVLRERAQVLRRSHPVPGAFANLNAGDATKWTYAKNPNVETRGPPIPGPSTRSG